MKQFLLALITALFVVQTASFARHNGHNGAATAAQADGDGRPFKVRLVNDEYKIFLQLNLYDKDVTVPGQDIYGQLDGYIGSKQSSSVWLITSSEVKSAGVAELEVINDYGSEDFTATLRVNPDGSYTLKKHGGSTLKFGVRGKWQKLPGTIELKKK